MPPKILVTGANGHLGANTVRSLVKNGYEVVPFDTEKVKQTFHYTFYPIEETLRDAISWFSHLGIGKSLKQLSEKFPPDPEWQNLHSGKLMSM